MSTPLEQKALLALRQYSLFTQGDRIAVGVSGGADSVALLRFLAVLREEYRWELIVCHIHHGLRGAEADRDEQFVRELAGQLGAAQAAETVRAFGEAFLFSMPTGKQNTFANRTLPDAVYVTLREDQPVNLCGAFERAVPRSAQGYAAPSKAALVQYAQQMYSSFAEAPAQSFTVGSGLEELAPAQTAKAMLDALEKAVRDALAGNEVG